MSNDRLCGAFDDELTVHLRTKKSTYM